jgi:hypothetical protein
MFNLRTLAPIAASAVLLAGAIVVPALAITEAGPLTVNDAHDGFAIHATQTGTGNGIVSNANTGTALYGVTNATSDISPGVLGIATNTGGLGVSGKGYEAGVKGQSNNQYGVIGVTSTNATAASYAGVEGLDQSTAGHHYGVLATSSNVGVEATGVGSAAYGVQASSHYVAIQGTGIVTPGFGGTGVWGRSNSGWGVLADASGNHYATSLLARTDGLAYPIRVYCACPGIYTMSLDPSGNMILGGTLTQYGTPTLVVRGIGASHVTYASQAAQPAVEDTGEGRIAGGLGYVPIDPAFAATLNSRAPYAVLVTPEGESRGLYVIGKTMRGFYVRESYGGRSSVDFAYRIVGRPASGDAPRLPLYTDTLKQLRLPTNPATTRR